MAAKKKQINILATIDTCDFKFWLKSLLSESYREKHDVRRLERVGVRQTNQTVVETTFVLGLGWASDGKVPFEWLVLQGKRQQTVNFLNGLSVKKSPC
jgi:hypothetical protein